MWGGGGAINNGASQPQKKWVTEILILFNLCGNLDTLLLFSNTTNVYYWSVYSRLCCLSSSSSPCANILERRQQKNRRMTAAESTFDDDFERCFCFFSSHLLVYFTVYCCYYWFLFQVEGVRRNIESNAHWRWSVRDDWGALAKYWLCILVSMCRSSWRFILICIEHSS